MTTYEVAARHRKAARLASVLREAGVSASVARLANEGDWRLTAEVAGVHPPSEATIALVIAALEGDDPITAEAMAEAALEDRQMMESGADRCPPRE